VATNRPTTRELADSIEAIDARTRELLDAIRAIQEAASVENDKMWTALRGVAGLDGLSTGVSEVEEAMSSSASEIRKGMVRSARQIRRGMEQGTADIQAVLAPLRMLVPPSTALPLQPGVAGALREIRQALGGRRDTNFPGMTTAWDGPVDFIGQADPSLDPTYPPGGSADVTDESYDSSYEDVYPDVYQDDDDDEEQS
jgi:hypothetical protein